MVQKKSTYRHMQGKCFLTVYDTNYQVTTAARFALSHVTVASKAYITKRRGTNTRSPTISGAPIPSGSCSATGRVSVSVGKKIMAARVALSHATSTPRACASVRRGIIMRSVAGSMKGAPTAVRGVLFRVYWVLFTVKIKRFVDCGGGGIGGDIIGGCSVALVISVVSSL